MAKKSKFRKRAVAVFLFLVILLSEWLWWESYRQTWNYESRLESMPLPFWLFELPHYFVVDLAIFLITACAFLLTILVLKVLEDGR